ncbi:glycosyltransferase family 32 protein [Butyrivibrio sp. ob235]|uniref:glycosyltransferase family 32 protein n=1 Tax=Butyrivibrio sp. ob235 TaxID=1761780 RepID=UPI000B838BE7|nr:glycosyltransferase [Butyrivibrio sp. ob235]
MKNQDKQSIPHIINYFWFGGGQKPETVLKYIDSWRSNCPDFEIKEWNESNYDIHKHPYMEKAYNEKMWAFVSDYARLDVLYSHGGVYLDTDVEVIKDFSPLCENKAFFGFENSELVNDGQGFGCVAGLPIFKEMLDLYDSDEAYEFWGGEKHNVESPKLRTLVLKRHGLRLDGSRQTVGDVEIFPTDFFCPLNYATGRIEITENTFSIHHFDGSWKSGNSGFYTNLMRKLNRIFGEEKGKRVFDCIIRIKDNIKMILRK